MNVLIVTPAPPRSSLGNAVTAQRYASFLRSARWNVRIARSYLSEDVEVLMALHARRSARSVMRFRRAHPERPVVLILTGTDVYRDLKNSRAAKTAIALADALVTLQPLAISKIPARFRIKAHSIIQSARLQKPRWRNNPRPLRICVVGHLRAEKDPLRAAIAARSLPESIRLHVTQAGATLDARYARAAKREMQRNPRYRWVGELSRGGARRLLRSSDLMVLSSVMEGGANVLCEAIACGVPILASRIPGNIGILGRYYSGYFTVYGTQALARLMQRAAQQPGYLKQLRAQIIKLRRLVRPARERHEWIALVRRLARGAERGQGNQLV